MFFLYMQKMPNLENLKIKKGVNLTNNGFYQLFDSMALKNLRHLNLTECSQIQDNSVIAMVEW